VEAKVVFVGLKVIHGKGFSIEDVNALPDPFDSDIDIMGYQMTLELYYWDDYPSNS
jgi:hypothetical protein